MKLRDSRGPCQEVWILGFLNGAIFGALVIPAAVVAINVASSTLGFRVGMEAVGVVLLDAIVAAAAGTVAGIAVALSRRDRESIRTGLTRLWKVQLILLPVFAALAAIADNYDCGPVVC